MDSKTKDSKEVFLDSQSHWEKVISGMRFPLIMLVIYIHMLPFTMLSPTFEFSSFNVYVFFSEGISHVLGLIAVPFFFVFSGYLFFKGIDGHSIKCYVYRWKKRVYSLLIPYLVWNTLMVVVSVIVHYIKNTLLHASEAYTMMSLFDIYWNVPANFPLWYIRELMIVLLLSPLIYCGLKYLKVGGLIIILVLYLYGVKFSEVFSINSLFYYGVGGYIAIHRVHVIKICHDWRYVGYLSSLILFFIVLFFQEYTRLFILSGMMTLIYFFSVIVQNVKVYQWLTKYAYANFFIYGLHLIGIQPWLKGALTRVPLADNHIVQLLSYFIAPIVVVAICLGIYHIWNRVSYRTLSIAIGGR